MAGGVKTRLSGTSPRIGRARPDQSDEDPVLLGPAEPLDDDPLEDDPPDFDPPTALDVLAELEPESLLDPESPELEPPPLLPEPPEPLAPLAARESVR